MVLAVRGYGLLYLPVIVSDLIIFVLSLLFGTYTSLFYLVFIGAFLVLVAGSLSRKTESR